MLKLLLFSVLIIAICWLFIAVKVWMKPNGKMSSQHIHDSPAMRRLGIHCVMDQDREDRQRADRVKAKIRNHKRTK